MLAAFCRARARNNCRDGLAGSGAAHGDASALVQDNSKRKRSPARAMPSNIVSSSSSASSICSGAAVASRRRLASRIASPRKQRAAKPGSTSNALPQHLAVEPQRARWFHRRDSGAGRACVDQRDLAKALARRGAS